MLKKSMIAGFATLALGLGIAVTAPISAANAGNYNLSINGGDGHLRIRSGKRHYHGDRHYRHHRRMCRPGRAVHKAEHRGVRHARVDRVNNRFVIVKGRKRGNKIKIAFYRDGPRCEIAWVKRKHRRNHGYRY